MSDIERELLSLNQQLLESIAKGDWETYQRLCDPTLTAFEPEARGHLVEGMEFHRFYFELKPPNATKTTVNTTMVSPKVRICGETAVLTYVRLTQRLDDQQRPLTAQCEETRVWQKQPSGWRHVHFHRSHNGGA
jgi:calcium/calmodulin-dependent protein kinase (CaM kinase) II